LEIIERLLGKREQRRSRRGTIRAEPHDRRWLSTLRITVEIGTEKTSGPASGATL